MGGWTKEPWEVCYEKTPILGMHLRSVEDIGPRKRIICVEMGTDDMERSSACVNALAGVPNPEGVPKLFEELKNLNLEEAQYDHWWLGDLCEALKACIETSEEGAKGGK